MNVELPTSILIIDDDEFIRKSLTNSLKKAGVPKVIAFDNGNVAWDSAKRTDYKLIMLDWNMPELSGNALFNRFRNNKNYKRVPIIIITGFLDKKNLAILEEFPLSIAIQKPFQDGELLKAIDSVFKETRWLTDQETKLQKLIKDVKAKKSGAFNDLIHLLETSKNHKIPAMAGVILKGQGLYNEAEEILKLALKEKSTSLMALNELGKLYLETGNIKSCQKILEKANQINIDNIERLCNLGQISLEQMNFEKADIYFQQALAIDKGNEIARSGKKLVKNITDFLDVTSSIPDNLSSLLNTIGIAMVKNKEIKKGMEHYHAALIHVRDPQVQARLAFNIGYAYKRDRKFKEASEWFIKSLKLDNTYEKAKKYLTEEKIAEILHPVQSKTTDSKNTEQDLDKNDEKEDGVFESFDFAEKKLENISKENFIKVCPLIENFLRFASEKGLYLESQLQDLYELYLKHGAFFNQALKQMLADKNPSVNALKNLLNEKIAS